MNTKKKKKKKRPNAGPKLHWIEWQLNIANSLTNGTSTYNKQHTLIKSAHSTRRTYWKFNLVSIFVVASLHLDVEYDLRSKNNK